LKEDRGAFKTIPRNSAQIGHFVMTRDGCGKDASPHEKNAPGDYGLATPQIVTNNVETLRYP
jgi:hypothetical protein